MGGAAPRGWRQHRFQQETEEAKAASLPIIRTKISLTETNQRLFILFTFLQNPTLRLRLAQFEF